MSRLTRFATAAAAAVTLALVPTAGASAAGPQLPSVTDVVDAIIKPSSKPRPGERCANENLVPTAANLAAVRKAVLCLHNKDRADRGLGALRENLKLRSAAKKHSINMDRKNFFAHDAPGGVTLVKRVTAARYLAGARAWGVGENIGWATGEYASPKEIQRAWMNSAGHKRNVLDGKFREVGIGVVIGNPEDSLDGAIYTVDFGYRR